ncbi:hypothetical protein C8F04DRAFT_1367383 [Mycena alexandri]|uniref:DNA2/NAM7 helicase helicase domain-containing protein n=1 Tax=Mycena alexandri TaxID=1745969 RepID=A0AAD6X0K4_9AGAR|nr:hypothetical protein C8F04DRAFT_1367383 [Mycena alexandri]
MMQKMQEIPRMDTREWSAPLDALAKLIREAPRLAQRKPTCVENEVDSEVSCKEGKLSVTSTRFKTRTLASHNQRIKVQSSTVQGKVAKFSDKTVYVDGRAARIALSAAFTGDTSVRVTTVGREGPTRSEAHRADVARHALQQTNTLLAQPFSQALFLGTQSSARPPYDVDLDYPHRKLNASQKKAVHAMLSSNNADRVVLMQGPPGTGKTTVIVAVVVSILAWAHDVERTVWVVAQSNVAVKNIAEKLADAKCDFTLFMSRDFN